MPQQAENPQRTSRGSRRPSRKMANSSPSHIASVQNDTDFSVDPDRHRDFDQPIRILPRNDHDATPEVSSVGNLELPNPRTPTRPRSMCDGFSNGQYQGNQSAPDLNQRRRKGRRSQGGTTRASGVRRLDPNEAPPPAPPHQPFTPSRPNETPVKAYAGPTFHASPAASSLPIPKFLSRSVPNVDKSSSLKSMMEQETTDTTSESDTSPFLENNQPTQDRRAQEDSPLDIFFQADRSAKAKTKAQVGSPAGSNSLQSESQNDVRYHSRQRTDSSFGGMFPLEMDGAAPETPGSANKSETITPAPTPTAMKNADYRDELRRAQTLELKKLLSSPKSQRAASSSPRSGTTSHILGSPSPKTTPRGGSPGPLPDATSRDQQRHAALLALAHKQISGIGFNNGSAAQRPPSSKLWKEISLSTSPGVQPPELPATPTQNRVQQQTSITFNGDTQKEQDGYTSPYSPFSSAFTPPAKPPGRLQNSPSRHSKDAKSIDEDLRRILKLDVLGGDGTTGVRS